jgi:4-amino-4-deoxy-L-arabinose transferase-like glycosyltransferase
LSAWFPLSEDEYYYLEWSKNLSYGYFDHPPLIALLIRVSTAIFGQNAFGVRFWAPPASAWMVYSLSKLCHGHTVWLFALFTPVFFFGSCLMTPDIPFLFFWALYFQWAVSLSQHFFEWSDDPVSRVYHRSPISFPLWFLGGILLGLGLLSKYTMMLAPVCLVFHLRHYRVSAWIRGFLIHALIAFVFFAPVFFFNLHHDFASFRFQWTHGWGATDEPLRAFMEFVLGQILIIGALPTILFFWQWVRLRELSENPILRPAFYFFTVPFVIFLIQAMRSRVEANWALPAYLSFFPMAQAFFERTSFKSESRIVFGLSFIVPLTVCALMAIHVSFPIQWIPPGKDRFYKFIAQRELFRNIAAEIPYDTPVFASNYQWVSQLRFHGVMADQLQGVARPSQFTLAPTIHPCEYKSILYLKSSEAENPAVASKLGCFTDHSIVRSFPLTVRGENVGTFHLLRYTRSS